MEVGRKPKRKPNSGWKALYNEKDQVNGVGIFFGKPILGAVR